MILDSPTKILRLVASATCDVTVSGYVNDTGRPSFSEETNATASTQTICLAPGRLPKVIEHASIKTTGGANTLTVQIYDSSGSTKTTQQIRAVLAADERLGYDADGWYVTDANGTTKVGTAGWVIAAGKIGTLSNSLTFAGIDGSTLNIGAGGTLGTAAYTASSAYEAAGAIATHAALQTGVHGLAITAAKTFTVLKSMSFTAADDTGVYTFPTGTASIARTNDTNTFAGVQTFSGVVALNVTPKSWGGQVATSVIEGKGGGSLAFNNSAVALYLSNNGYYDGANWLRVQTQAAAQVQLNAGVYALNTAPSGAADSVIAWTTVFSISNTGAATATGVLSTTDATDAANTTTASAKTAGGFAAVKQIIAGTAVLGNFLTAIPAGGAATCGFKSTSTANFGVFFGSGAPTLSVAKGSIYLRSDGSGVADRAYINTDGGTTWTALTTAA